jgi:hypothetical protein
MVFGSGIVVAPRVEAERPEPTTVTIIPGDTGALMFRFAAFTTAAIWGVVAVGHGMNNDGTPVNTGLSGSVGVNLSI